MAVWRAGLFSQCFVKVTTIISNNLPDLNQFNRVVRIVQLFPLDTGVFKKSSTLGITAGRLV